MCNPQLFQMFGTGVQGYGALAQGQEGSAAANYNARVADIGARDALDRGTRDESQYAREVAQVAGAQKAAFGASNVARSGTALDLLGDTAQIASEDTQTIRGNAAREAYGLRSQGRELRRQGRAYKSAGRLGLGATLLTGGARAYGMYKEPR